MDPITREEQLMAGEQLEPITRKEYFLAKAAGMDVETPEPITREEMFLSMISGGGTGGSGSADWNASEGEPGYVKNRTHYIKKIPIVEETTVATAFDEKSGMVYARINEYTNMDNLNECEPGDRFNVMFNGDDYFCVLDESLGLGNKSLLPVPNMQDTGEPFYIALYTGIVCTTEAMDATFSVHRVDTVKLNSVFLEDNVVKYGNFGEVTRFEWDGVTNGMENFVSNSFNYYKVSDIAIPYEELNSVYGKRSDSNTAFDYVELGTNCYEFWGGMVVIDTNGCKNQHGQAIQPPSTGTYFYVNNNGYGNYVEFDTRKENAILYLTGLNGLKYAICVDASGKLTATEVT